MERHAKLSTLAASVGRNVGAVVIFWMIAFAFIRLGQRALGGWPASEIGQLLACVLGMGIGLRMRAVVTAYFLAAMTAYSASELAIHFYYGLRAAQGAPTHFAVIGAGILGVVLGIVVTRATRPSAFGTAALLTPRPTGAATPGDNADGVAPQKRSDLPLQPTSGSILIARG